MTEYVVGIAVVLVIIVIAVVLSGKMGQSMTPLPTVGADTTAAAVKSGIAPPASESAAWTRDQSTSYVWGQVAPGVSSPDGNTKFLGITGSAAECEDSCGSRPWCNGYTWNDTGYGQRDKMCYGVSNIRIKVAEPGCHSGEKDGFSSTLSRRASLHSAGKETFGNSASSTFSAFDKKQHFVPAPSVGAALAGTFDAYKQNYVPAPSVGAALAGTFDAYKQNFAPVNNYIANKAAALAGTFDAYKQNMISPDPAFGTMWAGQHKTATLPI